MVPNTVMVRNTTECFCFIHIQLINEVISYYYLYRSAAQNPQHVPNRGGHACRNESRVRPFSFNDKVNHTKTETD